VGPVDPCAGAMRSAATALAVSPLGAMLESKAQQTQGTVGICGGASVSAFVHYAGEACFVASPNGDFAITLTTYHGAALPHIGASGTVLYSNARDPDQLAGPFHYAEGSIGKFPYVAGGSYCWGKDQQGHHISVWQGGWTPSIGSSGLVGLGYGRSNTSVYESWAN
jgi:hypothetical protein